MASAQHEIRVERPIEEVFDFLADGSNNPRWQPLVRRTEQVGPTLGAGTSFSQSMRHPLGFTVSADYRITAFERPLTLSLHVTSGGPLRPTISYALSPSGTDTTTLRCTVEYRPRGLGGLAIPVLSLLHPLFAWEASWVSRAREILESSQPAA